MDKPVLKSGKKKRKKVKQFETDPSTCNPVMEETLDMVWGRVIREAPMPPTLKSGVDQAEWNNFENRWEEYKKKALPSEIVHPAHLYSCLEEKLKLEFERLWPCLIPALMSEEELKLMVKRLAWQKEFKSFSPNQSKQLLGTTLTENVERDRGESDNTRVVANIGSNAMNKTVMRDRGVFDNKGVVAFNTRVVTHTEACHGCSNTRVVAFDTGVVAHTEACHGGSKMQLHLNSADFSLGYLFL